MRCLKSSNAVHDVGRLLSCVFFCMFVILCVSLCVCMCKHACMCVYMCVSVPMCVHVWVHVLACVPLHNPHCAQHASSTIKLFFIVLSCFTSTVCKTNARHTQTCTQLHSHHTHINTNVYTVTLASHTHTNIHTNVRTAALASHTHSHTQTHTQTCSQSHSHHTHSRTHSHTYAHICRACCPWKKPVAGFSSLWTQGSLWSSLVHPCFQTRWVPGAVV